MIIRLQLDLLNQEIYFRHIDRLLHLLEIGKHQLIFETDDIDVLFNSDWFDSLGERLQNLTHQLFQKAVVNSKYLSKETIRNYGVFNITDEEGSTSFIINAIDILEDKVYIVVEDIQSDKLFLNRIIEIYKSGGKNIKRALDKKWLDFTHSGGKTRMPVIIYNLLTNRPIPFKPRLIAIFDSDKKHLNEDLSIDTQRVLEICNQNLIPYHLFEKREIENYIPDSVLLKRVPVELTNTANSYCLMTPRQKDFFDLEKGFDNQRPQLSDPLFANYANGNAYHNLRYGFQRRDFDAKKEIINFVDDVEFNQITIHERCKHQIDPEEFKTVLNKIDRLL